MAAASYLFDDEHPEAERLQFYMRSGWLSVNRPAENQYTMDFPSEVPVPGAIDPDIAKALGVPVTEALRATDLIHMVKDA